MPQFMTVYFLSKEDIALTKYKSLLNVLDFCNVKVDPDYGSYDIEREILIALSNKITQNLMSEVCESPTLSVMIDESSDNTLYQYLTINIRYIFEGQVKERCCNLVELKGANADSIFKELKAFLYKLLSKVVTISTDGAAVMLGQENGVAVQLKQYTLNEQLIIKHCLSHRLNLGAKDLWQNDKSLLNFNNTLHTICRYFSKSSKKVKILEEEELRLLNKQLKLLTLALDIKS